ncbi:MAG: hypothetical protein DRP02_11790 [Candidatus Gerdarchaeota archaeon]|nr:MAG: hypothetical protein DRP02_11790 [Candidatus Gerdarchaeota archaeon]
MGSGFYFGRTSLARLGTCHPRIRYWLREAIKTSPLDLGIVCGYRDVNEQMTAYANGKSDARYGESPHNFIWGDRACSLAVDVLPYDAETQNYDESEKAVKELYDHLMFTADRVGLRVSWGGDFKNLKDIPHWEIII